MARTAYIGAPNFETVNLPTGYTQIEYIQSSGTQYIDTGFAPNQNTRVVIDFQLTGNTGSQFPFCARGGSSEQYSIPYGLLLYTNRFRSDYGSSKAESASGITVDGRIVADKNKNKCSFGSTVVTNANNTFQCKYAMTLFASADGGTAAFFASMKLYSCQVYDNGTMVRDFIPCINPEGVAGLYDMVNGTFYENAGTGTFVQGSVQKDVAHKVKKMYIGVPESVASKNLLPVYDLNADSVYGLELVRNDDGSIRVSGTATENSFIHLIYQEQNFQVPEGTYTLSMGDALPSGVSVVFDHYTEYGLVWAGTLGILTEMNPTCTAEIGEGHSLSVYIMVDAGTSLNATFYPQLEAGSEATTYEPYGEVMKSFARRVRKAYIGANGVAHLFFSDEELFRYLGAVAKLSVLRYGTACATTGNYALYAGGRTSTYTTSNVVDAFDASFVRSTPDALSVDRFNIGSATIGGVALFVGGAKYAGTSNYSSYNNAESYDESLVRTNVTPLSVAKHDIGSAVVGGHALFAGGWSYNNTDAEILTVDVYDESLVHTNAEPLSVDLESAKGVSNGKYALFVNDNNTSGDINHRVIAYDEELTQFIPDTLVTKTYSRMAVRAGKYALIAGGSYASDSGKSGYADTVEAYDESLIRYTITPLSVARMNAGVATVGDVALIVGGWISPNAQICVDVYDESLIRYDGPSLNPGMSSASGVTLGNSALFAGMYAANTAGDDVHVYQIL